MCMEASMGWIDATGQPIVDVIIEDISSLDQTITNVYNYDSVTKCIKKSLKKEASEFLAIFYFNSMKCVILF